MAVARVKIGKAFLDGREVLAGKDLEADVEFPDEWFKTEVGRVVADFVKLSARWDRALSDTPIVHASDADL